MPCIHWRIRSMPDQPVTIGIDVGTGGVRVLAATGDGEVLARAEASWPPTRPPTDPICHEQSPLAWWQAVGEAATSLSRQLADSGIAQDQLAGLAIDGTSGTLVALDSAGSPLRGALMYHDARAAAEAQELHHIASAAGELPPAGLDASFALAKILWLARHEPRTWEKTACFVHQADYIAGVLTGDHGVTDYSNALKTGYDLLGGRWPDWLAAVPGLAERLPRVVAPATPIGRVSKTAAAATGLPEGLTVLTGATDGTAACIASGLRREGDYNTTLGTTLVYKGMSRRPPPASASSIYWHKLPGGWWLPGAASNTGAEWIGAWFCGCDPGTLDAAASALLPGGRESRVPVPICYPLARRGERFPFSSPHAEGFWLHEPADSGERFAACLVGTALVERLAYQVLDQALGGAGGEVYCTGGGSRSDVWMQCRADSSGRVLHRPQVAESAFGSAILAAAGTIHGDLQSAAAAMVRLERSFTPRPQTREQYDQVFARFIDELHIRGYLTK